MEVVSKQDIDALIRDKYNGDTSIDISKDMERLAEGEPLAYVIGWIPFLGLKITLDSHPLIPRPETEWWAEELIKHINTDRQEVKILDLCAGSGAIGLAIEKYCPLGNVFFGELYPEHVATIEENHALNGLSTSREDIRESNLFSAFASETFDIIATNPPYIPDTRTLEKSVTDFEPANALFAGTDGLALIRRILKETTSRLNPSGELWMECDIENIQEAETIAKQEGAKDTHIRNDLYGRPRILVAYY